jgi:hypothetical protein
MLMIRRLLARSLLAPFLLLPLLSCGYPKPSADAVKKALARSSSFVEPKTVLVYRRLEAYTDDGGPLDDRQLAKVDGVLAVLRVNKLLYVEDAYAPVSNAYGRGSYQHVLTARPADDAPTDLFTETDEGPPPNPFIQGARVPGWRVTIAKRQLVGIGEVLDPNSPNAERLSPGYVLANFDFRWVPTELGKLFDQASTSFEDLPAQAQYAMMEASDLDSRRTYNARAYMTRGNDGDWRVTLMECRRCAPTH